MDSTASKRSRIELTASAELDMKMHNLSLEPELRWANSTGVVALSVSAAAATASAEFIQCKWIHGKLELPFGEPIGGFNSYGITLIKHSPLQQRANTLLITNERL